MQLILDLESSVDTNLDLEKMEDENIVSINVIGDLKTEVSYGNKENIQALDSNIINGEKDDKVTSDKVIEKVSEILSDVQCMNEGNDESEESSKDLVNEERQGKTPEKDKSIYDKNQEVNNELKENLDGDQSMEEINNSNEESCNDIVNQELHAENRDNLDSVQLISDSNNGRVQSFNDIDNHEKLEETQENSDVNQFGDDKNEDRVHNSNDVASQEVHDKLDDVQEVIKGNDESEETSTDAVSKEMHVDTQGNLVDMQLSNEVNDEKIKVPKNVLNQEIDEAQENLDDVQFVSEVKDTLSESPNTDVKRKNEDLNEEIEKEAKHEDLVNQAVTKNSNNVQNDSMEINDLTLDEDIVEECISENKNKDLSVESQGDNVSLDVDECNKSISKPKEDDIVEKNKREPENINTDKQTDLKPNENNNLKEKDDIETLKDKVTEQCDKKTLPNTSLVTDNLVKDVNVSGKSPKNNDAVVDILDVDEIDDEICRRNKTDIDKLNVIPKEKPPEVVKTPSVVCKLSNTLDILSDDEEETCQEVLEGSKKPESTKAPEKQRIETDQSKDKQCINIEDDDDIMVIDEDTNSKNVSNTAAPTNSDVAAVNSISIKTDLNTDKQTSNISIDKESTPTVTEVVAISSPKINEKGPENISVKNDIQKPLLPSDFLKSAKKNFIDMTREDLEEFCIIKIVESIVDRSNLSDIKAKLKTVTQSLEEFRKKAMLLAKQNRDLQVVLKSVQEEQKKISPDTPIIPLKITRSVGMQVLMAEQPVPGKRKVPPQTTSANKQPKTTNARTPKTPNNNQTIPVPRLVPAGKAPAAKSPSPIQANQTNNIVKNTNTTPNGVRNAGQKLAEKRTHSEMSVTVDLTDDEPPAKIMQKSPPPVRLVPPQNLLASQRPPFGPGQVNSPRKVYIPISTQGQQQVRPTQTIMLKTVSPQNTVRQRCPPPAGRVAQQNTMRVSRVQSGPIRHPAPLPDAMKQYQPPNWKALPPAPDLKLSKVDNGIVISWKIDGYKEDNYEEIASYQLYAYQETSSPPSTALWKKIGDVKALPLPMACTLTQFMAGFKYYFAVRAVDVRSRLGPFSLPGSILLLHK